MKRLLKKPITLVTLMALLLITAAGLFFVIGTSATKVANDELPKLLPDQSAAPDGRLTFEKLASMPLDSKKLEPFLKDIPEPHGLGVFDGALYAASWQDKQIIKIDLATGNRKLLADELDGAHDMVVDQDGKLVVALFKENRVVKIDRNNGQVATLATGLSGPNGIARARDGGLYVTNAIGGTLVKVGQDGTVVTAKDGLKEPAGVIVDADNIIRVAQYGDPENSVVQIEDNGRTTTIVRGLTNAESLVFDGFKNILIGHVKDGKGALSLFTTKSTLHPVLTTALPGPLVGPVTDGKFLYLESAAAGQGTVYRIPLP